MHQADEGDDQGQQTSQITHGPAVSRDASDTVRRGDIGEKSVVEDHAELEADIGHDEARQRCHDLTGPDTEKDDAPGDTNRGGYHQESLAIAAAVRQRSEKG